jgi:mono/diheme cytochrome c family protein
LQAALSLGGAPATARDPALMALLKTDATAPFMVPAVVSSLPGAELEFLERLVSNSEWREARPGYANLVESLAATILQENNPKKLDRMFQLVSSDSEPKWRRVALMNGFRSSSVRKLTTLPKDLEAATKDVDPEIAKGATELLARFDWPQKHPEGTRPLTDAEKQLLERGRGVYASVCQACHQPNGRGLDGLALPIVNSKWVLGDEKVLARILLKGKVGHFAAPMPPLEMMSDTDLAAAMTFIRRNWGHEAPPVSVATVAEMRRLVIIRSQPYTDAELESIAAGAQ